MRRNQPLRSNPFFRAAAPSSLRASPKFLRDRHIIKQPTFHLMAAFFYFSPEINLPMKRFLLLVLLVFLLALAFVAWRVFGPGTAFSGDSYALYVRTGMTFEQL